MVMIGVNKPEAAWGYSGTSSGQEPRSDRERRQEKGELDMFHGLIDQDMATPVAATAIPDVLFERGLYWASGRSGLVDLVAAHKWFNLAALKGRSDAIALRREVAEQMSDDEIARAQREARAWMSMH
jgi:hypothetical protein